MKMVELTVLLMLLTVSVLGCVEQAPAAPPDSAGNRLTLVYETALHDDTGVYEGEIKVMHDNVANKTIYIVSGGRGYSGISVVED